MPSRDDLAGAEDGGASALAAFVRSSKEDLMVELSSRRMVYVMEMSSESAGDTSDETAGEKGRDTFWIVPRTGDLLRVTFVPGGNGSLIGSVRYQRRPQVRPPSNRMDLGKLVTGRRDLSREKDGGQ